MGAGVPLNGATLSAAFDPQRADSAFALTAVMYFAADATTRGPWLVRVNATAPNADGTLTVHGFRLRGGRGEIIASPPADWFGRVPFVALREGGARAVVYLPQPVAFDFKAHPQLTLELEATVARAGSKSRRWLRLPLRGELQKRTEFVSVAGEISREFSRRNRPPED